MTVQQGVKQRLGTIRRGKKQRNKNKRSNRMTRSHMKSAGNTVSQPPALLSSPVLELWRMTRLITVKFPKYVISEKLLQIIFG